MLLSSKNAHPRDSRVTFVEESHLYYVDGGKVGTSVTSLIHDVFPAFDADAMARKIASGGCSAVTRAKYAGMTCDDIKQRWELDGRAASALGTRLHADIEAYFNDAEVRNDSLEWSFFLKFVADHGHAFEPYRTEWIVYDEDLDLAGSIDFVARSTERASERDSERDSDRDSERAEFYIYDWKRCKEIKSENRYEKGFGGLPNCNLSHYTIQLNMYRYLLQKHYGIRVTKLFLVVMHPNTATYNLVPVDILEDLTAELVRHRQAAIC
jgi:hypothetical protein